MTNSVYWLIASGLLILFEVFGIPGIGFLFAGIAAFITAGAIELGLMAEDQLILQLALFCGVTALSAALLWRKLKVWRMNPNAPHYSNIIGTEAEVTETLTGTTLGHVRWSGTLMRARLADPAHAPLTPGAPVRITATEGNVLIVTTK